MVGGRYQKEGRLVGRWSMLVVKNEFTHCTDVHGNQKVSWRLWYNDGRSWFFAVHFPEVKV